MLFMDYVSLPQRQPPQVQTKYPTTQKTRNKMEFSVKMQYIKKQFLKFARLAWSQFAMKQELFPLPYTAQTAYAHVATPSPRQQIRINAEAIDNSGRLGCHVGARITALLDI